MEAFYAKDVYNSAERLQEAIEHSSEDRDPGHGFEGNRFILLRITDVTYRCLKEELIDFEDCIYFTFLLIKMVRLLSANTMLKVRVEGEISAVFKIKAFSGNFKVIAFLVTVSPSLLS